MKFKQLKLKNFRNYLDLTLDIPPGVVVFHGPNGQGKTNLLEAVYYLLRGQSFRQVSTPSLLYSHTETAQVSVQLTQLDLDHDIRMVIRPEGKSLWLNNNKVSSSVLARQFPIVLFSPESLAAIKDGPDQRRQLLDDVVITHTKGNIKIVREFNHALKMRNRILRDYKRGVTNKVQSLQLLESLNPSYFPLATELTGARLDGLTALQDDFLQAARRILDQSAVDISVEYLISGRNAYGWTRSDLFSAMHKRVLELQNSELESGLSLVGPHRHDIRVLFAGKDSRFFCSQGQQRALILSFKMAQILYHYRVHQVYPLLLLDDVLSELDLTRRSNLVKFLKDIPAQIFLTTTDLSFTLDFGERGISIFRVDKGVVVTESQSK